MAYLEIVALSLIGIYIAKLHKEIKSLKEDIESLKEDKEINEGYIKRCHRIMKQNSEGGAK